MPGVRPAQARLGSDYAGSQTRTVTFSPSHPVPTTAFSLPARARKAMLDAGFCPDFPPEISAEINREHLKPATNAPGIRDLRALSWSSIDNAESKDLDQVEVVEQEPNGELRLRIG